MLENLQKHDVMRTSSIRTASIIRRRNFIFIFIFFNSWLLDWFGHQSDQLMSHRVFFIHCGGQEFDSRLHNTFILRKKINQLGQVI